MQVQDLEDDLHAQGQEIRPLSRLHPQTSRPPWSNINTSISELHTPLPPPSLGRMVFDELGGKK